MYRPEFIAVTALVLFVAFALGWFAYWLLHHFTRVTQSSLSELDSMATALHDAEEARDAALAHLEAREAELGQRLRQSEEEFSAAMDGLRNARAEIEDLRSYIERQQTR